MSMTVQNWKDYIGLLEIDLVHKIDKKRLNLLDTDCKPCDTDVIHHYTEELLSSSFFSFSFVQNFKSRKS